MAERAWGTVREDYSADGDAWGSFPHEHARSRAYRWNEDGMAAVCDEDQTFVLGLALWNGADPILKERMFGLTGPEGNHGEDVKEYWWYLDSTPTHSWMTWRYHYPQREFPYARLVAENARRGRHDPEFELADTGIFDDGRYWAVTVDYAKAAPHDLCLLIRVENRGPEAATLHVLPTLWFRNTWAWGLPGTTRFPSSAPEPRTPCSSPSTRTAPLGSPRTAPRSRCSATTRPTRPSSSARRAGRRSRRTASATTWSTGCRRSIPSAVAPRRPSTTC